MRALRILVSATAANRVANNLPTDLFSDVEAINGSFGLSVAYPDASGTLSSMAGSAARVQISDAEAAALRPRLHVRLTYWSSLQEPSGSDLPADYTELSWVLAAYPGAGHRSTGLGQSERGWAGQVSTLGSLMRPPPPLSLRV